MGQGDEDGEEGADVTERTGDLGKGLGKEGGEVVALGGVEVLLCFSDVVGYLGKISRPA